jgi:hypothetical protein
MDKAVSSVMSKLDFYTVEFGYNVMKVAATFVSL